MTATSTPACARIPSRTRSAERSASTGRSAAVAGGDVGEIDAGVRADEPVAGLGDEQVAAPAHDSHRLGLDEPAAGGQVGRIELDEAALDLGDDLLGDDDAVAVLARGALGARRVDDELGEHVAGADLGDALDGDEGQATGQPRTDQATAASACRASAAATRASRITVSATIAAHALRLDLAVRVLRRRRRSRASSRSRDTRGRRRHTRPRCRAAPSAGRPGP